MTVVMRMVVDGIPSELRNEHNGDRSVTRLYMMSLKRDNEAHYKINNQAYCAFCEDSEEIIVIE
jgi:hypothetical protein